MDFTKVNKKDFKCIKQADGAVYYGQMAWIMPNQLNSPSPVEGQPAADLARPGSSAEVDHKLSSVSSKKGSMLSLTHRLIDDKEFEVLEEEARSGSKQVRHGHGVQIYADGKAKYAG
jgi:hypothetical protein